MRHSTLIEYIRYGLIALPRRFMPIVSIRARPLLIKALAAKFNKYIEVCKVLVREDFVK